MFGSRNDAHRSAAIRSLKAAARTLFEAADDDAVIVNELSCTEPGCPPMETVVALLRADPGSKLRVKAVVIDQRRAELRAAGVERLLGLGHC
jgi:hypothetical protein